MRKGARNRLTVHEHFLKPPGASVSARQNLTHCCPPEVDHSDFCRLTRTSADAHEAALLHLPPVVCARTRPTPRSCPWCSRHLTRSCLRISLRRNSASPVRISSGTWRRVVLLAA